MEINHRKDQDLLNYLWLQENASLDKNLQQIWGEQEKEPFILQVVGETYYHLLCEHVHPVARRFEDLYLVLYRMHSIDGFTAVVLISHDEVFRMGFSEEWLMRQALKSTRNLLPPRLYLTDWIAKVDRLSQGIFMPEENGSLNILSDTYDKWAKKGFRLTNTRWEGGAIAIFYPGVLTRIYELMHEEFYVVFLGTYEVRIHPKSFVSPRDVSQALQAWNVANTEDGTRVLTYKLYVFKKEWTRLCPVQIR